MWSLKLVRANESLVAKTAQHLTISGGLSARGHFEFSPQRDSGGTAAAARCPSESNSCPAARGASAAVCHAVVTRTQTFKMQSAQFPTATLD